MGIMVDNFQHVASKGNVADLLTRGQAKFDEVKFGSTWQTGPGFLAKPRSFEADCVTCRRSCGSHNQLAGQEYRIMLALRTSDKDKIYEEPNAEMMRRAAILLEIVYSEDVIKLNKRSKIARMAEW
jgi:hypothetical protein